jgi:hypothetical protein
MFELALLNPVQVEVNGRQGLLGYILSVLMAQSQIVQVAIYHLIQLLPQTYFLLTIPPLHYPPSK